MPEIYAAISLALFAFIAWSDLTSVKTVARALGAVPPGEEARSLRAAYAKAGGLRGPALRISPDPLPRAWIVRSAFGAGTIIVSRGLLATLGENELRAVLQCARQRIARPTLPLRTAFAAWAARLQLGLRASPLTPLYAVLGWMLFPLFIFLGRQSREIGLFDERHDQLREPQLQQAWLSALTRVTQAQRLYGNTGSLLS